MARGVNGEARNFLTDAARERVKQLQAFNFVVKQFNANGQLRMFGRKHIDGVATHAKFATGEVVVVAFVLHAHQLRDHITLPHFVAGTHGHDHAVVAFGLANAVNGRHGGHHDHIASFQNAFGAAQTHLLNVLVDGAVFFNEQITLWHIGFGLVVVVVADEILHRVFRKELAKLAVQLRSQCFVGRKNNGGTAHARNHVGHGESFARACHAQQGLKHFAVADAFDQLVDGRGLVARRWVRLKQLEGGAWIADELPLFRSFLRSTLSTTLTIGFGGRDGFQGCKFRDVVGRRRHGVKR